jgi:uncharacterized protein (TIGR02284 family)
MQTSTREHACDTEALNSLLRGEVSAAETYTQAMGKFDDQQVLATLQRIREEHGRAVQEWRDRVVQFGGTPSEGSGAWGTFAAAVTGTAKAVGPGIVLAALKQGEEHGIGQYEAALENQDVHPDCHQLIRTDLLPACRKHVAELDRLIGGMDN